MLSSGLWLSEEISLLQGGKENFKEKLKSMTEGGNNNEKEIKAMVSLLKRMFPPDKEGREKIKPILTILENKLEAIECLFYPNIFKQKRV
jgi:hypothetical protein